MADTTTLRSSSRTKKRKSEDAVGKRDEKRRRSSFVRGRSRKSLGAADVNSTEIHKSISTELPAEERLSKLHVLATEHAFRRLEDELPLLESMSDLKDAVLGSCKKSLEQIKKEGLLQKACGCNKELPNPWNVQMEEAIHASAGYMEKLHKESEEWDKLLAIHSELADRAKSSVSEDKLSDPAKAELSTAHRKLLSNLPDLTQISDWVSDATLKLPLQVDYIDQNLQQIKNYEKCTKNFLENQIQLLESKSFGHLKDKDPKELMQQMLSLK